MMLDVVFSYCFASNTVCILHAVAIVATSVHPCIKCSYSFIYCIALKIQLIVMTVSVRWVSSEYLPSALGETFYDSIYTNMTRVATK